MEIFIRNNADLSTIEIWSTSSRPVKRMETITNDDDSFVVQKAIEALRIKADELENRIHQVCNTDAKTMTWHELLRREEIARQSSTKAITIMENIKGKIISIHIKGKVTFMQLEPDTNKSNVTLFFHIDNVGASRYGDYIHAYRKATELQIGDFLQVDGEYFETKAGEKALRVKEFFTAKEV